MLAAIVVGALTAWYLGMRAGVIAAGVTFVALMAAMFVPGLNLAVYGIVLAWCAALYFLGPKMSKQGGASVAGAQTVLSGVAGQAKAWLERVLSKSK